MNIIDLSTAREELKQKDHAQLEDFLTNQLGQEIETIEEEVA